MSSCSMTNCLTECTLINWSCPKTTGMVLASINIGFITLWLNEMSIVSLASNMLLLYIISSIVVTKFLGNESAQDENEYEYFSKETLEKNFKSLVGFLICLDTKFRSLVRLENPLRTAKYLGGLYVASLVASCICTCLLAFVCVNALFLFPLVLKYKKAEMSSLYDLVVINTSNVFTKVSSMIPKYVEKAKKE